MEIQKDQKFVMKSMNIDNAVMLEARSRARSYSLLLQLRLLEDFDFN